MINRNFTLLWVGQTISMLGDTAFSTTIVLWIALSVAKNQSWAPLAVSGALLASYVPVFLFGIISGVFVDRWEKRRTTLIIDAASAIVICLFLVGINVFSFSPAESGIGIGLLVAVYIVVFVLNAGAQFFRPAMLALVSEIVEEEQRGNAVSLNQLSNTLAMIVAPPLATLLFFSIGVQWLLLIDMLSFLFAFFSLYWIQMPRSVEIVQQEDTQNFLQAFRSGLVYVLRNRQIVALTIATLASMLGAGALNALDIFFLSQNLRASQSLYGLLDMALGIGLVIGALLSPLLIKRIGQLRVIWSLQVLIGVLILVYARMTAFLPALILLFIAGWPLAVVTIAIDTLLLRLTAHAFIGRVLSLFNVMSALGLIIGSYFAGFLVSTILVHFHTLFLGIQISSIDTVISGVGVLLILSGCYTGLAFRSEKLSKATRAISEA